jgi:hypothetical protein
MEVLVIHFYTAPGYVFYCGFLSYILPFQEWIRECKPKSAVRKLISSSKVL